MSDLLFHILADRIGLRGRAPAHYPMLENSDFCVNHNSEDRWQPRWKIPQGFGGLIGFAACDPPTWLAVTTTSLDDAMSAGTRFSQLLNLRVFNTIDVNRTLRIAAVASQSGGRLVETRSGFSRRICITRFEHAATAAQNLAASR
jgi:hypothetical protein